MIILGAGLTGCLAGYAFKNAVIHEYLETPNTHKALLRFRSDKISELTGIPFKKVTVQKGIFYNGEFQQPTIRLINLYSHKVTGGYYDRSIANIDPSVRFIAPLDFHDRMLDTLGNRVVTNSDIDINSCQRPVVSTLPLPVIANKLGIEVDIPKGGKANPIYVSTVDIPDCDTYQTIYFPGIGTHIYRASLTGSQMIVESIQPISKESILEMSINVFGISISEASEFNMNTKQEFGKFIPLDSEFRKDLMFKMTQEHGIYSLGRHATWRKVLLDDVNQDIQKIERMIKHSAYDLMVGLK